MSVILAGSHRERALADDDQWPVDNGNALCRCLNSLRLGSQRSDVVNYIVRRDLAKDGGAVNSQCGNGGREDGKTHDEVVFWKVEVRGDGLKRSQDGDGCQKK